MGARGDEWLVWLRQAWQRFLDWLQAEEPRQEPDRAGLQALASVTGLGPKRDPGAQAWVDAAELPERHLDLRGGRDTDPNSAHPWRPS